ncbi:MAG TPA: hypothetical protein PLY93_15465 [Turneriella sp.]|nr:hypothetical protein [Turneriella sp.]
MLSLNPILIVLTTLSIIALAAFLYFSVLLHRSKDRTLRWRGIVKTLSLNGAPNSLAAIYSRWFIAFVAVYILACVSVGYAVWHTDHSFLIVIFPLLFYYFFARYFLWEKADLID